MQLDQPKLKEILAHFAIEGHLLSLKLHREGHINTTLFSTFEHEGNLHRYTHQRINTEAFKDPFSLMKNISAVTSHIRGKLENRQSDIDKRVLTVIPTRDGELLFEDEQGGFWRTYRYIDHVRTYNRIENEEVAHRFGAAVGTFQLQLADFDGSSLFHTIPRFHDMRLRYEQLQEAIKVNHHKRVGTVADELAFLEENKNRGCVLTDALAEGKLPLRVTHNDTKVNNVLFSLDGSEALCIIDLDTVMPGTILFDTGDMLRTGSNTGEEDTTDLDRIDCAVDLHRALLSGYRSKATFLTALEEELLVESGRTITQIMAVRFLTDYLNGDVYYHIEREEHNLDRARTQIALMRAMDRRWNEL
jgi:Ser/Thr protein kinase RdoA (MazF antagonist)